MVWARVDDGILDNDKIVRAGVFGFALHMAAITWCCRNLTDGIIPAARVTALLDLSRVSYDAANPLALIDGPSSMGGAEGLSALVVAEHLVDVGLWERVPGGYEVHDFLEYNPSREQVTGKRKATKERVAKHRNKAPRNAGGNAVTNARSNAPVTRHPDPDPDPEPKRDPERESDARAPEGDPWPLTPASYAADVFAAVTMASGVILDGGDMPAMWAQFVGHLAADSEKPGAAPRPATRAEWQRWVTREARRKQESAAKTRDAPNRRGSLLQHDPKGPGYETGDWDGT
jgi:hypothetical protein